nr:MAG TPA: hypothetical protein [Caudoviricetes sp.]
MTLYHHFCSIWCIKSENITIIYNNYGGYFYETSI